MDQIRVWQPRFKFPCYEIPQWLRPYSLCRYRPGTLQAGGATHSRATFPSRVLQALYHRKLVDPVDRIQMAKAIDLGETFGIVAPPVADGEAGDCCCVAAITFVVVSSGSVVILAVDPNWIQNNVAYCACQLHGASQQSCHESSPEGKSRTNKRAWKFYGKRGMRPSNEYDFPSAEVVKFFTDKNCLELIQEDDFEATHLIWLILPSLAHLNNGLISHRSFLL